MPPKESVCVIRYGVYDIFLGQQWNCLIVMFSQN